MALTIDNSRPLRGYSALKALIEDIRDCGDPGAETHAVEWKATLDLGTSKGQYAVARTIIGMGNRTVDGAARAFSGVGYLVVGATVGDIPGTDNWDGQQLEPLLNKYLGADGPVWAHANVDVDGKNVVVFTIEPPAAGDKIHTLRYTFSPDGGKGGADEGTIFVRHNARTERATTADIRALEARLAVTTGQPTLAVTAATVGKSKIKAFGVDVSESSIESMVALRRHSLQTRFLAENPGLGAIVTGVSAEWQANLSSYLDEFRAVAGDYFTDTVLGVLQADESTRLAITNLGDEAVEGLLVKITFPRGVKAYYEKMNPELPREPDTKKYSSIIPDIYSSIHVTPMITFAHPNDPIVEINDGRYVISEKIQVLHGGDTVQLKAFMLLFRDIPDEPVVQLQLTAKATNRSGLYREVFDVETAAKLATPAMVRLAKDESAED